MAKVIDALVVTLGLDPSGYKKGASDAKAAQASLTQSAQSGATATQQSTQKSGNAQKKLAKEQREREREEKKRRQDKERADRKQAQEEQSHTDATIDHIKSVGLAVAGAVVGFNSLKGALGAYVGATNQLANLGRVAPTIGTDVKALDKLGDAYKQVKGTAEEAGSDIAKLAHAQFSFAINAPDAMAGWARRLGVSLFDEKGNPREKLAIQDEIAASLKRQTSDIQTQAMYAREMGLSEAFIQLYLVKSNAERAEAFAKADKTAKATEAGAKAAQDQEQAWARIKNNLKGVGENIVTTISPGVTRVLNSISNEMENAKPFKGRVGTDKRAAPYRGAFAAAEKKYGLPSGILESVAHRESDFDPTAKAVSKKTGKVTGAGLMGLNPSVKGFENAGQDVNVDIDKAAREYSRLYKHYRKMYPDSVARDLALKAYNDGQGNIDSLLKGGDPHKNGGKLPNETARYAPAIESYAGYISASTQPSNSVLPSGANGSTSGAVTNTTHIEQLNVHTQATDANGIAQALPDALRRQNLVTQGNSGLQ